MTGTLTDGGNIRFDARVSDSSDIDNSNEHDLCLLKSNGIDEGKDVDHGQNQIEVEPSKVDNTNDPLEQTHTQEDYVSCFRCLNVVLNGSLSRCAKGFPRSFAFFTGVVLPLFLLILLSYVFGWFLACVESPGELDRNDAIVEANARLYKKFGVYSDTLTAYPLICLELFKRNQTTDWFLNEILVQLVNATKELNLERITDVNDVWQGSPPGMNASSVLNFTVQEMSEYMEKCGEGLVPLTNYLLQQVALSTATTSGQTLKFSWNRCSGVSNETEDHRPIQIWPARVDDSFTDSLTQSAQAKQYVRQWREDQQHLYHQQLENKDQLLTDFMAQNGNASYWIGNSTMVTTLLQLAAYDLSVTQATGRKNCTLNLHASVWFWFTVMTTVGYGNQPPVTRGGRLLVFSFGFLSILIFGAILGQAGSIVTIIVDDFFARTRWLYWVREPRAACLLWGVMAFLWMLVIATQYVQFKRLRLDAGDEVDFSDGYWFAYISTLTVGLGDYYLDPEVLTASDLVSFPLSFLIGFTFFSGFLGYFSKCVSSPFKSPKILSDNLNTPRIRDESEPSDDG